MFTPKHPRNSAGFTLVELLTVIAIIAILMGILFPTIGAAIENAKKTQAKNDELQLVNAIKAYYTEYGRYPIDPATSAGDVTYGSATNATANANQNDLMNVLRYPYKPTDTPPTIVTTLNPRKINFLEVREAKNVGKAGKEREGIGGAGAGFTDMWLDPWGNVYAIKMDGDYDNSLTNPYGTGKNAGAANLSLGVIVWTYGRDSKAGVRGSGDVKNADDVLSWQ